jgi:hypothetical protein
MESHDAIIVGAGAAGLYAAAHAGRRGRRVLVLEHNAEPGAKILISGGGRCNFTNVGASDHRRYLSVNPHFARSALTRHPPADFLALAQKHDVAYYEKTLGQLFCEGARSSQKIVRLLLDECAAARVVVLTGVRVETVNKADRFRVDTTAGAFAAETLTVATGGLSIPKLGATDFAFAIAKRFGVPIVAPRPGLVPLVFGERDLSWMRPLAGVAADIAASAGAARFREAALFTHRGLSGPAILQASSYWREGDTICIDWLPSCDHDWLPERKRARPRAQLKTILSEVLSERLAATLAGPLPESAIGDMKDGTLRDITRTLKAFALTPVASEGYAKAEVTVGGVDTDALSQQTMECRAVPGLFFIGECVDVAGWLGGYNFQWAWSSGWAAALAI